MKNIIACLTISLLSFVFIPCESKAAVSGINGTEMPLDSTFKSNLSSRISEIKTIGKSGLSMEEMKKLRKDMRETKERRGLISAVFFMAVGAFVAFILILIFFH
jgi:hypothetical protein